MRNVPLPWYCPEQRAILEFDELNVSRSLAKSQRQARFSFTIDSDFDAVIQSCAAAKRPEQGGTWITADFMSVYSALHSQGMAHSVEAWNQGGQLVGGLYGVDAGGVFCGESMFHVESNASKAGTFISDRTLTEARLDMARCAGNDTASGSLRCKRDRPPDVSRKTHGITAR
jgi:leucyl/phenylalanyl-tRNA--protein transferase